MRSRGYVRLIVTGALCALLLLLLFQSSMLSFPLALLERTFFAPLYQSLAQRSFVDLTIENKQLRATLREIVGEEYEERTLAERTARIQTMEEWAESREFKKPIIATPFSQYEERGHLLFLLNRGERDGVKNDATVILDKGMMIGRILRTAPSSSLMRLITAKEQKLSVRLDNPEQTPGLLRGMGEGETLQIHFVPRELPTEKLTRVLTSGNDPHVPSGLLLGLVQETRTIESTPWKELVVTPFIRPADLLVVGILQEE